MEEGGEGGRERWGGQGCVSTHVGGRLACVSACQPELVGGELFCMCHSHPCAIFVPLPFPHTCLPHGPPPQQRTQGSWCITLSWVVVVACIVSIVSCIGWSPWLVPIGGSPCPPPLCSRHRRTPPPLPQPILLLVFPLQPPLPQLQLPALLTYTRGSVGGFLHGCCR